MQAVDGAEEHLIVRPAAAGLAVGEAATGVGAIVSSWSDLASLLAVDADVTAPAEAIAQ